MKIECMNQTHVAAVAALEKLCFADPWSENAIASELSNPLAYWLVAMEEDRVVGYIGSQSVLGEADMMNIAVDPAFRRRSVARLLIEALVAQLRTRSVTSLTLEVRASNETAIALYEKTGFRQVGRRPSYYRHPKEDAWILRKEWEV